jgi:hypothetical protein
LLATKLPRAADPEPTLFGRLKRNAVLSVQDYPLGFSSLLLLMRRQMRCDCCFAAAPDALLLLVLRLQSRSWCADTPGVLLVRCCSCWLSLRTRDASFHPAVVFWQLARSF